MHIYSSTDICVIINTFISKSWNKSKQTKGRTNKFYVMLPENNWHVSHNCFSLKCSAQFHLKRYRFSLVFPTYVQFFTDTVLLYFIHSIQRIFFKNLEKCAYMFIRNLTANTLLNRPTFERNYWLWR